MAWTLCSSGAAIVKAGVHANATIIADGASMALISEAAEGLVEAVCRRSWVANHAKLSTPIQGALANMTASIIASDIVVYDNTGYLPREADMIMNYNDEIYTRVLNTLKNFKSNEIKEP